MTLVSILIPAHNAGSTIERAVTSAVASPHRPLQICIYDDGSTDNTWELMGSLSASLSGPEVGFSLLRGEGQVGVGGARNAVAGLAEGEYYAWLDADDEMLPCRIGCALARLETCSEPENTLLGAGVVRPGNATPRYTEWANSLDDQGVMAHAFRECTLLQPTWFCHASVFARVGGYDEEGLAEDLKFFYAALEAGVLLAKIDHVCVVYHYSQDSLSWSVPRKLLLSIRVAAFERMVLPEWDSFMIWGAGRDGKAVYRALSDAGKAKVAAFVDIDPGKLKLGEYLQYGHVPHIVNSFGKKRGKGKNARKRSKDISGAPSSSSSSSVGIPIDPVDGEEAFDPVIRIKIKNIPVRKIPILPISDLTFPFITCVALDRTNGEFEANLASTNARPTLDFHYLV